MIGSTFGSIVAVQWQCGSRPTGWRGGRWIGRMRARVGGDGGRVERRVFDVVAHRHHEVLAHRLDVEERAARLQPELAVAAVDQVVANIHVLVREPDVELEPLEDGVHVGTDEVEGALHALRVDGARAHPLEDGDLLTLVLAEVEVHPAEAGAREQEREHHVLASQVGQLLA